jgi:hypothetical protein
MSVASNGGNGNELQDLEAWLTALESMIALLAARLPAPARERFAAALHELEATTELDARLSWSAALRAIPNQRMKRQRRHVAWRAHKDHRCPR